MKKIILFFILMTSSFFADAQSDADIPLLKAHINLSDEASLQRGAKIFMNYCMGCHSLGYMRYNRMAKDIGILDASGKVDEMLLKDNLIFTSDKPHDLIQNAIPESGARQWFGVVPPDLTLIARIRGVDWLKTYLHGFYKDLTRPWGTNNILVPNTAMPNALVSLQGIQIPLYRTEMLTNGDSTTTIQVVDSLVLLGNGTMSRQQFDTTVDDLVNFLAYTSEPMKLKRQAIGWVVLIFLIVFTLLAYQLKNAYWKKISGSRSR